ncbi:MAG: helix-turn-helix domain-containing protein [Treponemataceae bacterium]|nr:helix-turn-helix domain-containing protein [Treponemataceae bacterium]
MSTSFIERLNEILESRNMSQASLAESLSIGKSTISGWRNGTMPSVTIALGIAKILNTSVEYLITGQDSTGLTNEERTLLKNYRKLSPEGQDYAQDHILFLLSREIEKKENVSSG